MKTQEQLLEQAEAAFVLLIDGIRSGEIVAVSLTELRCGGGASSTYLDGSMYLEDLLL